MHLATNIIIIIVIFLKKVKFLFFLVQYMCILMLPDCNREYLLKKSLGGACPQTPLASLRLRRSIGKFQFLWTKPNPMPVDVYT